MHFAPKIFRIIHLLPGNDISPSEVRFRIITADLMNKERLMQNAHLPSLSNICWSNIGAGDIHIRGWVPYIGPFREFYI